MKQKVLSALLALCMVLSLLPGTAQAAGTTIHVGTSQELYEALRKSNVTIVLEGKDYTTDYMFSVSDVENVTIQGTAGTRLLSTASESVVIWMRDSKNIVLDNLVIGHDIAASEYGCTDGVIHVGATTLTITNCDIFGCGLVGIDAYDSTITVENSTIRDCSKQILDLSRGNTVFKNCVFSGNGYNGPSQYAMDMYGTPVELAFYNCTFKDNKNPEFASSDYTIANCTFTNNSWSEPSNTPAPQVMASKQNLSVNGKNVDCEKYNIDGANYFKLRDLAYMLNGTGSQFAVHFNAETSMVIITTGAAYTPEGSELKTGMDNSKTAQTSRQTILIDGATRSDLTVYNIGGSNFFQLRELGNALGFNVDYNADTNTAVVLSK